MFMKPETLPAEAPPISAVTDQKLLWERESAPAPPARTNTASCVFCAREPTMRKIAARASAKTAILQRPARGPHFFAKASFTHPPASEQTAMARKGKVE